MKEQWFIPFSVELNVGLGGTESVCRWLIRWEISGWWLVIVALPCYGEFKGASGTLRLLMSRQSARRCRLCAWQGADSSLSPSSSGGESKTGSNVYDGREAFFFIIFFFKGKHHRALDGRDPNRDVCDVMRQTGTYFSHVEMSGRRVLVGRTVPSLSWVKEGFTGESCRDRGADQAPWSRVLCSLFRPQKFIYAVRNPTQFIQSFYFGRVLVLLLIKNWP